MKISAKVEEADGAPEQKDQSRVARHFASKHAVPIARQRQRGNGNPDPLPCDFWEASAQPRSPTNKFPSFEVNFRVRWPPRGPRRRCRPCPRAPTTKTAAATRGAAEPSQEGAARPSRSTSTPAARDNRSVPRKLVNIFSGRFARASWIESLQLDNDPTTFLLRHRGGLSRTRCLPGSLRLLPS